MAVYCKFRSAKEYFSVLIEGQFISVGNLKDKIIESKHFGRATDFDLVISNAQTNEEYLDDGTLVSKNSSILVRRVPGIRRMPIVIEKDEVPQKIENPKIQGLPPRNVFQIPDSSQFQLTDDLYEDEFGNDLYALPEVPKVLQSQPAIPNKADASQRAILDKADEDGKIKAFVDASASEWQGQTREGYAGRGYVNGAVGMGPAGRGFGRGMGWKSPPEGYVCHRCNVPGHFIQHCPTNGDTNFDIKRVKMPTGIPKCMLVANPDGIYALPSGAVAVLRPNEAAFEKEFEGLPSTRHVGDIPPELHCPLCKTVIKDAVLTSKCCFKSYCDKCIRDHIISKSKCECGATNILADDLLPNKTLRDAINRILETTTSSAERDVRLLQTHGTSKEISVTVTESGCCSGSKVPSPSLSRSAKQAQAAPSKLDVTDLKEKNNIEKKPSVNVPQQSSEENQSTITADQLEGMPESMSTKELLTRESVPILWEEVKKKPPPSGESANKKKKQRVRQLPSTNGTQCRASQDFGSKDRMMPYAYTSFNPYLSGIQFGTDGYTGSCGSGSPFMGYGLGPSDTSYMPGFVPPVQRVCMDYGMGTHHSAHMMSREEFEAKKVDLRNKLEQQQPYNSNNRTKAMLSTDGDGNYTKAKEDREMSMEWHRECEPPRLSPRAQAKRKADRDVFQTVPRRVQLKFPSHC